jgi:hypothetical protein
MGMQHKEQRYFMNVPVNGGRRDVAALMIPIP